MSELATRLRTIKGDGLTQLLLEAPATELEAVLDNPSLEDGQLTLMLRRVDLGPGLLRRVFEDGDRAGSYLVKSALVTNPHTPKVVAMSLVKFLFWRDLVKVLNDFRLDAGLRRLAEVTLKDRLTDISLGERISLARMAPREAIKVMRSDHDPRVVSALLENSRTTEEDLSFMVLNKRTPPKLLTLIARHPRWGNRYGLKLTLLRNPRTPGATALPMLSSLLERDLASLLELPNIGHGVRQAVVRLLEDRRTRSGGRPAARRSRV